MSEPAAAAWAYLVVSSEQQAETLAHQRAWAEERAREKGWALTRIFEGVSSGRDGTRGLLEKLLDELRTAQKASRPQRVLMIRLDRMGRGLGVEALAALAEVTKLGATIHTRQDGDYILARASDSILPLMRIITGAIENEARRDKATAVYARRRAANQAPSNKRPYGLKMVDLSDVPDEPRAGIVRLAFELASNGYGYAAIGNRLQAIAPPKIYSNGREHKTTWSGMRVRSLLTRKAYRGLLVSAECWDQVQLLMRGKPGKVKTRHPWTLTGALRCSCGRNLVGSLSGSPPVRVYRCTARAVHGKYLVFRAKRLEQAFLDVLARLSSSDELDATFADQNDRTKLDQDLLEQRKQELHDARLDCDAERDRVWKLNRNGLLQDNHMHRRLSQIDIERSLAQTQIEEVENEISDLRSRKATLVTARSLVAKSVELWNSGDVVQKKAIASALSRALNGLCVDTDGTIYVGKPKAIDRFLRLGDNDLRE